MVWAFSLGYRMFDFFCRNIWIDFRMDAFYPERGHNRYVRNPSVGFHSDDFSFKYSNGDHSFPHFGLDGDYGHRGCLIMMHRRFVDEGLIATQWFERDWLPLILLVAVSVTGLGIWFDYSYLEGKMSQFMAIIHAITVAMFLMWIPFGKFFHIFQRPAQVGANIYKIEGKRRGMQTCPHTGDEYTTSMHIEDLKEITQEMGFDLENEEGKSYSDFSPEGKRAMLAKAHLKARQESGTYFG